MHRYTIANQTRSELSLSSGNVSWNGSFMLISRNTYTDSPQLLASFIHLSFLLAIHHHLYHLQHCGSPNKRQIGSSVRWKALGPLDFFKYCTDHLAPLFSNIYSHLQSDTILFPVFFSIAIIAAVSKKKKKKTMFTAINYQSLVAYMSVVMKTIQRFVLAH